MQDERRRINTIDNRTYLATSWIFGDKDAGYRNSNEYIGGLNVYLAHSRNYRINTEVVRHLSSTTARAESTPLARETNNSIQAAGTAPDTDETASQNTAIQESAKLLFNELGNFVFSLSLIGEKRF